MKKNTASQVIGAQMISATDGSAFTSSVTVYVTGDGGTQATGTVGSGACTHEGNGFHTYAPSQAETNYDHIAFTFIGTGAIPATVQVYTSFPQTGDNYARLGAPAGASVSADVAAVKAVLPAALVGGRMDSSVGAMASGVLTATAIAADAITDAKVASDVTIASVTGSVGSVTGNVGGNVTGSVGSIGTGGITAASFAAGAIDNAAIAADAIGSSELAASAVTEIQAGLSTLDAAAVRAAVGLASANLDTQIGTLATAANLATVASYIDTEITDIQNRLPAALVSGRIDASVGAMASNVVTAASVAADAGAEIATAVRTELTTELARIDVAVSTRLATASYTAPLDAAGVRSAVGLASANLDTQLGTLATAANLATVAGYIDTEVASIKSVTDILQGMVEASVSSPTYYRFKTGAVEMVWDVVAANHVTSGSTGEALAAAGSAGDPWATALPGAYSSGQAGYIIGNRIDAAISSRLAAASYTAPLDAAGVRSAVGLASANLDTQLGTLATAANLATVAGYIDTEVAAIKAKTDNLPASPAATSDIPTAAAVADAVWDEAIAGHAGAGSTGEALSNASSAGDPWTTTLPGSYTSGQAGYILGNRLDAAVSSRLATASYTAPLDAAGVRSAVGLASANLDTQLGTLATAANLATVAGYIDTEVAAIKAKTDNLPASPAATSDIPTAAQVADKVLGRNLAGGSDGGRTVTDALRPLRNKVAISGGTMNVYREDDTTVAWDAVVTTTAGDPLSAIDPA